MRLSTSLSTGQSTLTGLASPARPSQAPDRAPGEHLLVASEEVRLLRLAAAHALHVNRGFADEVGQMARDAPPDMHPDLPDVLTTLLDRIDTTLLVSTARGNVARTHAQDQPRLRAGAAAAAPVVVHREWWEARRGLLDQQPGPDEPAYLDALAEITRARTALRDTARWLPDLVVHQPLPRGFRGRVGKQIDLLHAATIGRLDFHRRLHSRENASLFAAAGITSAPTRDSVAAEFRDHLAVSADHDGFHERRSA